VHHGVVSGAGSHQSVADYGESLGDGAELRARHAGYLETIRNTKPANSRWKILVVDAFTKQHLNHVLKVYDILEEGVQRKSSEAIANDLRAKSRPRRPDLDQGWL
jgi:hypothetical protein